MKEVKLLSLTLNNFKGIKQFTFQPGGENARVFGDNETGKTTLFDAFTFVLFGKDSQNKTDFAIKTLINGKEANNLNHEVEASFLIDGSPMTLRKVYSEKWTQVRGAASKEFSGHVTKYYIDGVPQKKKEYTEAIDLIVQEDAFKLLTSPSFFNEQMKWQDRRTTLLEICGDVSEEEVFQKNDELKVLPLILKGKKIEDLRKIVVERRKDINDELKHIPVRIDEIQKSIPVEVIDVSNLKEDVIHLETKIDENITLISNIKNGKSILEKERDLQQIENDLLNIKRDYESDSKEKLYQLQAKSQEEKSNVLILKRKISERVQAIEQATRMMDLQNNYRTKLLDDWKQLNGLSFVHKDTCDCPACGQALPEEQLEAVRTKALEQFNKDKSEKLQRINEQGKEVKEKKIQIQTDIDKQQNEHAKFVEQATEKDQVVSKLASQLESQQAVVKDVSESADYQVKLSNKQKIVSGIQGLKESVQESIRSVETEINELKDKKTRAQVAIARFANVESLHKRISDLCDQEKLLTGEYEKLEHQLYLTEQFIRAKVELLEERINAKFEYARFKMFSEQINGGLQEVCETTYKGIPFSSMNNAARINVGIDIINTLSTHYGIRAPIFIDNRESVVKLADSESQLISLIVSEQDKQLRVEIQSEEEEAV
ncbi:AAA family ATPase [Paenisporosarcina sp. TG-14]|uniref:AAA family ATPase n=1 Tax=Paenisporosarcina sp. TG-14 TaxID=1231057 RepID=UPI0002F5964C|nr:AAA family ATPase [Paenisporosarcina sp. TG-14]